MQQESRFVQHSKKDRDFFLKEARIQIKCGSDFLDLNAGTGTGQEAEDLAWLINLVQSEYPDIKLTLDSSNTDVLAKCLPMVKNRPVMLNSINAEKKKLDAFLPLLKEFPDVYIIALTMDDSGIPSSWQKRVEIADILYKKLTETGIKEENIFYDGLVQPVGTDSEAFINYLRSLKSIKQATLQQNQYVDFQMFLLVFREENLSTGMRLRLQCTKGLRPL